MVWLFSFRGRVNRVRFLAGVSATLLLGGAAMFAVSLTPAPRKLSEDLVAVAALWPLLALQVKRLRDIGVSIWVLPATFAVSIADRALALATGWRFLWPEKATTAIGGLVGLAYLAALLLWPSKPDAASAFVIARPRLTPGWGVAAAVALTVVAVGLGYDPWTRPGCPGSLSQGADCTSHGVMGRLYSVDLMRRANEQLDAKAPTVALQLLDRALKVRPNYVFAYNSRAIAYDQLGDRAAALREYSRALELAPSYMHARYNRGSLYATLGDRMRATKDFTVIAQAAADPHRRDHAELQAYVGDAVEAGLPFN